MYPRLAVVCALVLLLATVIPVHATTASRQQFDALWRQTAPGGLRGWTAVDVGAGPRGFTLAPHRESPPCSRDDVDGRQVHANASTGLCAGRDTPPHTGRAYYNGGRFWYGVVRSPVINPARPVDDVIVSWQADTPAGTWIETHIQVREAGRWSHLFDLPIWASNTSTIRRHSVDGQHDGWGRVNTDTFVAAHPATSYRISLTLFTAVQGRSPTISAVTAAASRDAPYTFVATRDHTGWGIDLAVPQRSQMLPGYRSDGYGGGGEAWCSPTSTSMVMAYWATREGRREWNVPVPAAAADTYDATYGGTGNWPFNTAFAASYGLSAYVARLPSLTSLGPWIAAGIPVVISIAFQQGELPGEPVGFSPGHLIVVRGFTQRGDVITNDPAAYTDAGVRIVFPRAALERAWQEGSHGTAYIIYPPGRQVPHI